MSRDEVGVVVADVEEGFASGYSIVGIAAIAYTEMVMGIIGIIYVTT